MSKAQSRRARNFWPLLVLLAILTIVQGFRSARTVGMVLAASKRPAAVTQIKSQEKNPTAAKLDRRADWLAHAAIGERDPFRDPPAPRVVAEGPPRPAAPRAPIVPTLRTLLYDRIKPSVQLSGEGGTSAWLHVGDSYQGWKVTEINENSVRISQGSHHIVLSAF